MKNLKRQQKDDEESDSDSDSDDEYERKRQDLHKKYSQKVSMWIRFGGGGQRMGTGIEIEFLLLLWSRTKKTGSRARWMNCYPWRKGEIKAAKKEEKR